VTRKGEDVYRLARPVDARESRSTEALSRFRGWLRNRLYAVYIIFHRLRED
jgi:hypothetical protein